MSARRSSLQKVHIIYYFFNLEMKKDILTAQITHITQIMLKDVVDVELCLI